MALGGRSAGDRRGRPAFPPPPHRGGERTERQRQRQQPATTATRAYHISAASMSSTGGGCRCPGNRAWQDRSAARRGVPGSGRARRGVQCGVAVRVTDQWCCHIVELVVFGSSHLDSPIWEVASRARARGRGARVWGVSSARSCQVTRAQHDWVGTNMPGLCRPATATRPLPGQTCNTEDAFARLEYERTVNRCHSQPGPARVQRYAARVYHPYEPINPLFIL